jgi:hypothetical protein
LWHPSLAFHSTYSLPTIIMLRSCHQDHMQGCVCMSIVAFVPPSTIVGLTIMLLVVSIPLLSRWKIRQRHPFKPCSRVVTVMSCNTSNFSTGSRPEPRAAYPMAQLCRSRHRPRQSKKKSCQRDAKKKTTRQHIYPSALVWGVGPNDLHISPDRPSSSASYR